VKPLETFEGCGGEGTARRRADVLRFLDATIVADVVVDPNPTERNSGPSEAARDR